MNVTIEDVSACRKRLRIEVPANEVNAEVERLTDEFRKVVRIPGFRAGKVPRDVVAKRFRQDIDDGNRVLAGIRFGEAHVAVQDIADRARGRRCLVAG